MNDRSAKHRTKHQPSTNGRWLAHAALSMIIAEIAIAAPIAATDANANATPRLDLPDGWTLTAVTQAGVDTKVLADKGKEVTLFIDGRKIWGSGGCNSYQGKARFRGDQVEQRGFASTEKACLDQAVMKQESTYFSLLNKVSHFDFDGSDLILSDGTDNNRLRFTPSKPKNAKTLIHTRWIFTGFENEEKDTGTEQEWKFLRGLETMVGFEIDGRTLTLSDKKNSARLQFEAAQ